jgi:hypothetical protein
MVVLKDNLIVWRLAWACVLSVGIALESAERRSGPRLQGLKQLECEKSLDVVNPRCGISRKEKVSHGKIPHVEPPLYFPALV